MNGKETEKKSKFWTALLLLHLPLPPPCMQRPPKEGAGKIDKLNSFFLRSGSDPPASSSFKETREEWETKRYAEVGGGERKKEGRNNWKWKGEREENIAWPALWTQKKGERERERRKDFFACLLASHANWIFNNAALKYLLLLSLQHLQTQKSGQYPPPRCGYHRIPCSCVL